MEFSTRQFSTKNLTRKNYPRDSFPGKNSSIALQQRIPKPASQKIIKANNVLIRGSLQKFYLLKYFFIISLNVRPTYGRKMMKGYLPQKYQVSISQERMTNALETVDRNYNGRQEADTARQTSTILYRTD